MQINHPATLTFEDHAKLERLMCTLSGSSAPVASLLRRKLETAVIAAPEAARGNIVTSGSRVRYRVNGAVEAEHSLIWDRPEVGDASAISLQWPLGLALLGLSTGQSISFRAENGIDNVEVLGITQPAGSEGSTSRRPPALSRPLFAKLQKFIAAMKREAGLALARIQKGRTEVALTRLSDAALKDIGITRGEISHAASVVAGLAPSPTSTSRSRTDVPTDRARISDCGEASPQSRREISMSAENDNARALHSQNGSNARLTPVRSD